MQSLTQRACKRLQCITAVLIALATQIQSYDYSTANDLALDAANNVLVVGATVSEDTEKFLLRKFTPEGELDSNFGTDGEVVTTIEQWAQAHAIAMQPDGGIVIAGRANTAHNQRVALARYNSLGVLDPSFGTNGILSNLIGERSVADAIAIASDGSIIIGGFATIDGTSQALLQRFNSNGILIQTATLALGHFAIISALAIDTSTTPETIVASGHSRALTERGFLARYQLASLTLDNSFGYKGVRMGPRSTPNRFTDLSIDTLGNLVVGGTSGTHTLFARYLANGNPDISFGRYGFATFPQMYRTILNALTCQPDGKIIGAGILFLEEDPSLFIARSLADGSSLDFSFGQQGGFSLDLNGTSQGNAVALDKLGNVYAAGNYTVNQIVVSLDATSTPRSSFGENGIVLPQPEQYGQVTTLCERHAPGIAPGPFTTEMVQRTLNVIHGNRARVTLTANQFTLQPGTYLITASAPACNVKGHQIALYNTTRNATEKFGSSAYSGNRTTTANAKNSSSELTYAVTVLHPTTYEIRHHAEKTNKSKTAQGIPANTGNPEIYTQVTIMQL